MSSPHEAGGGLLAELDGGLSTPTSKSAADLDFYSHDFGRLRAARPFAVATTRSELELGSTLALALKHGMPFVVRGAGHSSNGQTLLERGLVIRNFEPSADVRFAVETGLADVAARSTWLHVQRALNEHGRACPVLTDYLLLSVGGTLSMGGASLGGGDRLAGQ